MKVAMLAFLILITVPTFSMASETSDVVIPYLEYFESASQELEIPKAVALAIARIESGLYPWSLNIEGQSFRFNSKKEALAKALEARRKGHSFDIGIMQINRWWLDRYDISLEAAFDPLANIYLGGWILKGELVRHKNLRAAIGAYHSPDPIRANRYAVQVMEALKRGPQKRSASSSDNTAYRSRAKNTTQSPVTIDAGRSIPAGSQTLKIGYDFDQSMKVRKGK